MTTSILLVRNVIYPVTTLEVFVGCKIRIGKFQLEKHVLHLGIVRNSGDTDFD